MNTNIESRLAELKLELPPVAKPAGLYKPVLVVDNLLYVSGQLPLKTDGTFISGRLGDTLSLEEGKLAARQAGLTMLSTIKSQIGDLNRIKRIVKTMGMVNCTPEFGQHPAVINGFSELMADILGTENGIGVRSAVGMFIPMNVAVEVEAIFELY
jgi:enamine deaminase RidA (YjgF/YER057c/UK114 family)